MAKQNIYDDPEFFAGYRNLRDNLVALYENVMQPMLPGIVPELAGKTVVDLGCGEGFFCRLARSQGAAHVIGVDPSAKMLAVARERTDDEGARTHKRRSRPTPTEPVRVSCKYPCLAQ